MGRSSRLFEIIQILRHAPAPVSAGVIAGALEVSKRTVYRDIVTLQVMRVPVEGEAGVGYVLRAGFDLPPLMFTSEEIEAIAVGLSLIGRTGDADLLAAASRVSQKISDVLPDTVDSRIDTSPLYVSHWNEVPPAPVEYRVMRHAIREERKLHLSYADADARNTERTVCPIALIYYVDNVLLAAWCELREGFRHFRVDRMKACRPIDSLFTGEGERLRSQWRNQHALFPAL
ncbi:helix-turn-helix transcriptional regulator [Paenirhodobacter sp.]|uniref:helix-turn-helix transcriptional regulator n=1 Tax=Paenirhodobacter sp. TaxID=1965326 RepID=UPI003B412A14